MTPKEEHISKCTKFGYGFDSNDDICLKCDAGQDCLNETMNAKMKEEFGATLEKLFPTQIKTKVVIPQAEISKPYISSDGKVTFLVKLDAQWLKKVLGWEWKEKDDNEKGETS